MSRGGGDSGPPAAQLAGRLHWYWGRFLRDLLDNLRFTWPIFAAYLAWVGLSSAALLLVEHTTNPRIYHYGDAAYYTFMAMFGEDISPRTAAGRMLYVADAAAGLVLFGFVVYIIVEVSAARDDPEDDSDHS